MKVKKKTIGLLIYFGLIALPIYWMLNMSLRTNASILGSFVLFPFDATLRNYIKIFTDASWYMGYVNSMIYVTINVLISLSVALPAAYAFSRYRFLGDKHVFFWLLTNRMAPVAVFALPFFQLYSTLGLLDTHIAVALAHTLFNVPLAVWILEGFMSGVPNNPSQPRKINALPSKVMNNRSPRVVSSPSTPRRGAPPGRRHSQKIMPPMQSATKTKKAAVGQVQAIHDKPMVQPFRLTLPGASMYTRPPRSLSE